jgi:hypothetical protein
VADPESESLRLAKTRLGRKAQVGGGVAAFVGVLLLVATPSTAPGAPIDLHRMAAIFIAIGAFLFAAGTFGRWYYLG